MTRARAAAKSTTSTEPTIKTTRIVTAATKAKATRSTATAPTSSSTNKRKVRPDDAEDEDPLDREAAKPARTSTMKATRATRGRPKKAVDEPAPEPVAITAEPTRAARGRPKKTAEPTPTEPPKPSRTTRTRKTKAEEDGDADADVEVEPPKKATRGRPPASSTITSRQATAKPTIKKSVKFEEPEKENMIPPTTAAGRGSTKSTESASGLRAKPMRRPGVAGRAVRGTGTKASALASDKGEKPLPLSPKKVNQLTLSKTDSDDELAMNDKPPARSLMRNPIKPPVGSKKGQPHAPPAETDDGDAPDVEMQESVQALMLGTPAKRLPASPWKNSIKSPAKRVEGVLAPPAQTQGGGESSRSPVKMSLLQSPAKRAPVMKSVDFNGGTSDISPMKMSLLSSPAKRTFSPMKAFAPAARDGLQLGRSPAPKPTMLATPLPAEDNAVLGEAEEQEDEHEILDQHSDDAIPDSPTRLRFPGRLSAVLPRYADPVLKDTVWNPTEDVEGTHDVELDQCDIGSGEPMVLDDAPEAEEQEQLGDSSLIVASASSANPTRSFGLRDKDLQAYNQETDSEDELSPQHERFSKSFGSVPSTPCPRTSATPKSRVVSEEMRSSRRGTAKRVRMEGKFGFTPLADQLNGWTAGPSPLKTGIHSASPAQAVLTPTTVHAASPATNKSSPAFGQSLVENQFFEDEMMIRPDATEEPEASVIAGGSVSPVLEDIPFTEEDVALAAEANEMSLMEPERVEELIHNQSLDDSLSEASQEYGDENAIPIDPTLVATADGVQDAMVPLVTPQRVVRREFHTVSKVPLKPAAEETPRRMMKTRSHSISRLPVQRPTRGMTRNATVISYSPTKNNESNSFEDHDADQEDQDRAGSAPSPVTPQKSEFNWSTVGTPARTPRRDIDPALLRGAVVFVDVHTSEGADASGIFVELLSQMGARCVKSWSWNPSSPPGKDGHSSKVGITHVVYKDGGKRTLEKVRESGGVVQCVGVSWVLE